MTLKQIASLGRELVLFLRLFAGCFGRQEPRELLHSYVQGQLSSIERKSVEPMALEVGIPPRTLQRFLESIQWDEEQLRDRCQQIVAEEHADPRAIGIVDESGVPKSGQDTVGIARQWCGRTGKVDNCVVSVHISYAAEDFLCLLDSTVYLPESWAFDPVWRRKAHVPEEVEFRTKPQIAQEQIERALNHGIRVSAWTFDELYGRDSKFLDFLQGREQNFVAEVPVDFHGWVRTPVVLRQPPPNAPRRGRRKKYPRLGREIPSCEVRNLLKYSPEFRDQPWQAFHIKDSDKGPVVWEVKWASFYRKQSNGLPSAAGCLIVARNVLNPKEVKYFAANQVPGENGVTLNWLLWVAFRRWPVERCFREAKNELGMDHYEVRGWRCLHRHFYITQLSQLFCARLRQKHASTPEVGKLTVEQVRDAMNVWLDAADLPRAARKRRYEKVLNKIRYYQRRNEQARKSHTKTRHQRLEALGIDVDELECCIPHDTS